MQIPNELKALRLGLQKIKCVLNLLWLSIGFEHGFSHCPKLNVHISPLFLECQVRSVQVHHVIELLVSFWG